VEWSYRLLEEGERRVFRAVSVFPGPFTLEAAEAVAGAGAGAVVLRLVDCSLLVPPRAGPDGRWRYVMLETLRAYGAGLLAGAGEQDEAAAALARWAVEVAGQAAAGLQTAEGELAAARRLDAEDATMSQVLAWGMGHDAGIALRVAVALAPWWELRGRLTSHYLLLREAAGHAAVGSDGWCAAQFWLGCTAQDSADLAASLGHFTALRDAAAQRGPCRALADGLTGRAEVVSPMGRYAEAAGEARRSLAVARELGYPGRRGASPGGSHVCRLQGRRSRRCGAAGPAGRADHRRHPRLERPVVRARLGRRAERSRGTGRRRAPLRGDPGPGPRRGRPVNQAALLAMTVTLDLEAGRFQDAAAHLREALQLDTRTGTWLGLYGELDWCGLLCAATGRYAEAVTVWAARAALQRHEKIPDAPLEARLRREPQRKARQALGPARARAAEERGAAMTMATAAEYALLLTDPGPPLSAGQGAGMLSARERELVILVARGRTDAQIAAQLYISIRTVRSHLDRIRDKTGCRRRADLTRLALSAGLI
jgi:DNA-binding CsgD family transcriptional regulator/tetratricopeptide (TPR) repeat protein